MGESTYLGVAGCDQLSLRVLRYQFPGHARRGDTDSNWLMVEGRVKRADDQWDFVDPCLLTTELAGLIEWLRALPGSTSAIHFMEPLLHFGRLETDEPWSFRVTLRAEAVPASVSGESRWQEGITLCITTSQRQRDAVLQQLEADLVQFPPR
jgi:hypothetical protein